MKQRTRIARSPLRPSFTPIARSTTPIARYVRLKSVNVVRMAKLIVRSAAKHRRYMKSQCRRDVDARANGQCEAMVFVRSRCVADLNPTVIEVIATWERCTETTRLQHHHLSYHNYGGGEVPKQMLKCCRRCHRLLEKLKLVHRPRRQVTS